MLYFDTISIIDSLVPPMQPYFVLHKASSEKHDRKSARRKKDTAAPANCTRPSAECKDGLRHQLQREAFEVVWSKIENAFKVSSLFLPVVYSFFSLASYQKHLLINLLQAVLKNINSDAFSEIYSWVLESFQAIKSFGSLSSSEAIRPFPIAIDPASKRLHTGLVLTSKFWVLSSTSPDN